MSKKALKAVFGLILCVSLLTLALTPLTSWAQEPEKVTINYIETDRVPDLPPYEVHVYVTVSDAEGVSITEIDADSFTVLEDAKVMTVAEVAQAVDSIAVALVLDTSDSMRLPDESGGIPVEEAKKAAGDFIWSLADHDRVAVLSFNEEVTTTIDFTIDHGAAINAVNRLTTEPKWTCLYDAAFEAVEKAADIPEGRRTIVLLTDGKDQIDSEGTPCSTATLEDVTDRAEKINVPIYTIGLGNEEYLDTQALERLAKLTGGQSLFAPTSAELQKLFGIISDQLKNQYVIKYRSEAASAGYHSLKVKVQHGEWGDDDQKGFYTASIPTIESATASPLGPVTQGETVAIEVTVTERTMERAMVKEVRFHVDGEAQPAVTSSPYIFQWDTTEVSAGPHTLRVEVYDDGGPTDARELSIEVTPLPTSTPTSTSTPTPTSTPTSTPTPTPTPTPILTLTPTPTPVLTLTPTPTPTSTPILTLAPIPTLTPTPPSLPTPIPTPTPISCRPEIAFVSPPEGEVKGEVTVEVEVTTCQDRVKEVRCEIDGEQQPTMTSPPYSFVWDSAQASKGGLTLRCQVYDDEGVADTTERRVEAIIDEGIDPTSILLILAAGLIVVLLIRRRRRRPKLEFFDEEFIPEEMESEQATADMSEGLHMEDISVSLVKPIATLRIIQSVELSSGETFELFARSTSIGRGPDNEILIPDRPVSRYHANLIFREGHFRIRDLDSSFGTKVNGKPVPAQGTWLRNGDKIHLGTRTVLEFTQLEAELPPMGEETQEWRVEQETRDIGEDQIDNHP